MQIFKLIILFVLLLAECRRDPATIQLPSLIGDNMLLQQKTDAKIWGKAYPGKKITVTPGWGTEIQTIADKDSRWSVKLHTPGAGGPHTIKIESDDTVILIKNVLIGEVWFCSGQSNMELPMEGWLPRDTIMNSVREIASAGNSAIRLFKISKRISGFPLDDCEGKWEICSSESVRNFSATAFFFGKKLNKELQVPVGLIESAYGGSPIESWISAEVLENTGEFVPIIKALKDSANLLNEYQAWVNRHKQIKVRPSGIDQWKDLNFDDNIAASIDFDDSSWPEMVLPSRFEDIIGEFDGAIWFRKKVEIPPDFKDMELVLSLGTIDNMDCTYFNGVLIGSTDADGFSQKDRNYNIPHNLVREGINTIAVRVLDIRFAGGISGTPGSMKLMVRNGMPVPVCIEGIWKYHPVAELIGNNFYVFDLSKNEFSTIMKPKSIQASTPTTLYNAMVYPVINYRIKGAIWYQGESNVLRADQYAKIFPLMIQSWRDEWKIGDFPFYYVQIAPYMYSDADSTESAYFRDAQSEALRLKNTGMVITLDISTIMNIHPPYKMEVGERLANLALVNDYSMKIPISGPVYKSMVCKGNCIIIQFENVESGLTSKTTLIPEFEIAGKNRKYVKAIAKIMGNEVIVFSPEVMEPKSVRYCWRNGATGTLFNREGLPALQFSTEINADPIQGKAIY
jgi:sialate O-acetylesterase